MGKYLDKNGLARVWDKVVAERRAKQLTNQNLNDIKTDGYYYGAGNNTVTGGPSGTYDVDTGARSTIRGGFGLLVQRMANGWYRQELWLVDDGSAWQRHWNSSAWGSWQRTNAQAETLDVGGDAWQHYFSTSNASYIRLMSIRKVSGYVNTPITFKIWGRSGEPAMVSIKFFNDNTGDAALERFCYVGNSAYPSKLWLYHKKASTEGHGQWELWLQQTQGWDSGFIYDIRVSEGVGVKLRNNTASSLPVLSTDRNPTDFLARTQCSVATWEFGALATEARYVRGDGSRHVSVLARQGDVLTSAYDGGTGFSAWAFGVTRDTAKGYIGVLKPNVNTLNVFAHSPLLAFGTGDTHALLGVDYTQSGAKVVIGAGHADKLNWYKELMFTDSSLAYSKLTGKPDVINMLESYKKFMFGFSQSGNTISFSEEDAEKNLTYVHTVNFKTVNGASLIGNGNISIETGPKDVASGTDLNTVSGRGLYFLPEGASFANLPPSYLTSRNGWLLVTPQSDTRVSQIIYQPYSSARFHVFYRYRNTSASWRRLNLDDLFVADE